MCVSQSLSKPDLWPETGDFHESDKYISKWKVSGVKVCLISCADNCRPQLGLVGAKGWRQGRRVV